MRDTLIFAYGTLRPDASAGHRMAGRGHWLGNATAMGRLYVIDGYPCMVEGDTVIQGELFAADDPDALLAELDVYEGCGPDDPEPHEYRRTRITVSQGGRSIWAWTYLYNWPVDPDTLVESGDFAQCSTFVLEPGAPKR